MYPRKVEQYTMMQEILRGQLYREPLTSDNYSCKKPIWVASFDENDAVTFRDPTPSELEKACTNCKEKETCTSSVYAQN